MEGEKENGSKQKKIALRKDLRRERQYHVQRAERNSLTGTEWEGDARWYQRGSLKLDLTRFYKILKYFYSKCYQKLLEGFQSSMISSYDLIYYLKPQTHSSNRLVN